MILLDAINHSVIDPAFSLLPPKMRSLEARLLLNAITLQEADGVYRVQHGGGPARGLWQFEENGGVQGVLNHPNSRDWARAACHSLHVPATKRAVWESLAQNDVLAGVFARLLLWTDFNPLPAVDDMKGAWTYYLRLWRPGKPHLRKWPRCHRAARQHLLAPRRTL